MELTNRTTQPQQIEFVDGSVELVRPNDNIIVKPNTVRKHEFDRALKFFKIVEKKLKAQPQDVPRVQIATPTESEPIQPQKYNKKEVDK